MSVVISCDGVFNALTRGPFPTGDEADADVELHLRACHSCRQLAEALRPAVHLFHESMAEADEVELPMFRGFGTHDLTGTGELTLARAERASVACCGGVGSVISGGLIGIAMTVAIWLASYGFEPRPRSPVASPTVASTAADQKFAALDREGRQLLASLKISWSCISPAVATHAMASTDSVHEALMSLESDSLVGIACCTRCHFSGSARTASRGNSSTIAASCVACHRPRETAQSNHGPVACYLGLIWRTGSSRAC